MTITLPPHQTATSFLRHDSTVLQTLFTQLEQLRQLNSILADHIDPSLVNHCLITSLENGCLMLATESAIWGTHIRFQVPHLIAKLQSYPQFKTLRTIHCKVVPAVIPQRLQEPSKPRAPMRKLSPETAEMVLDIAKNIQGDKLKAIMERIAKRAIK